jgi:hypothetical protein
MVIRPVFDVVFKSYSIFFLDKSKTILVPELRWFPSNPATGTKLVNALLAGPSSWLADSVVSAIPIGTVLSIDAVTVQREVALVDLSERALVAELSDRSLMKAQLVATLSQLPTITQVSISIERSAQDIPDSQLLVGRSQAATLLGVGEEGLQALTGANQDETNSGISFFGSREVSSLAVSRSAGKLAAVTGDGVAVTGLSNPGGAINFVDPRASLVAIDYDSLQNLWLVSRSQLSVNSSPIQTPWLAGAEILDFALSPEGSRVAVLVGGRTNQLLVAGIVRDENGSPIRLASPIAVTADIENPSKIAWFDSVTVAVLNSEPETASISLITIGGTTRPIQGVNEVISLAALGDGSSLYALKESGELVVFRGSFWSSIENGISAIAIAR